MPRGEEPRMLKTFCARTRFVLATAELSTLILVSQSEDTSDLEESLSSDNDAES